MAETNDYRKVLTDKLIEQLEAGTAPWQKPWDAREGGQQLPYNPITENPYRGANSLYLTLAATAKGYTDPRWATYNQAQEKGWQVRANEKGVGIEYWKFSEERTERDEKGRPVLGEDGKPKKVTVMLEKPKPFRATVFNVEQMNNVPELAKTPRKYEWDPNQRAEAILQASGAKIHHDQADRAFYSPSRDEIHLPARGQFKDQTAYYSTALHELGHWTGHESRLKRDFGGSFGSEQYAKEELRAELSSYFMADKLGVPHEPGQHAAYVKSWVKVLQDDKNEIFRAARDAEKITDYVLALDRTRERERGQDNGIERGQAATLEPIRRANFEGAGRNEVQEAVARSVEADPDKFIERFKNLPQSLNGRFISADTFKETFEQYRESNDARNVFNSPVHNSAAVLASEQLRRVLAEPPEPGRDVVVLLTGVPGAGKTSAVLEKERLPANTHAVYEGQLATPETAIAKVQQVLDAGFKPVIVAVHPTPEKALDNTLQRFEEVGRGASLNAMAKIQGGLPEGLAAVRDKFGEAVELNVVDRRKFAEPQQLKGWQHLSTLESEGNHEQIKERLGKHLEGRRDGISEDAYRQAAGQAPIVRERRDDGRSAGQHAGVGDGREQAQGSGQAPGVIAGENKEIAQALRGLASTRANMQRLQTWDGGGAEEDAHYEVVQASKKALGVAIPDRWNGNVRVTGMIEQEANGEKHAVSALESGKGVQPKFYRVDAQLSDGSHEKLTDQPNVEKARALAERLADIHQLASGRKSEITMLVPPPVDKDLATDRTPLQVPYKEKEEAKALGAKWDKDAKNWYAPPGADLDKLVKWLPAKEDLAVQKPGADVAAEAAPYRVDVVKRDGTVVSSEPHTDPEKAMRAFVNTTKQDIGQQHGPGAYSALVDQQGKLDAGWVAEGAGVHRLAFAKDAGQAMYASVEKAMEKERNSTEPAREATGERTWLAVPYPEKDRARDAGAKWDKEAKSWYAPPGADLDKLERWVPKKEIAQEAERKQSVDPKVEFAAAIKAAGLVVEGEPVMDGKLHRVPVVDGKKGMTDGAYVGYLDGKPSGHIQNFKTGHKENWTAAGVQLSAEEQAQLAVQAQLAKQQRAAELAEQHAKAATRSVAKWERLPDTPPGGENAYLARKGVEAHGVKFDGEKLVVPVRDVDGKLHSLQSIPPGEGAPKMFEKGGRKTGNMHVMGELKPGAEVLVAEGYATGASLHQATGKAVAVAFDSGNLDPVVAALKGRYPTSPIYIMGDNDKHQQQNVGVEKAMAAAQKHQVGVAFPEFKAPGKLSDFNDLHKTEGLGAVKVQVDKAVAQSMEQSRQQAVSQVKMQLGDGAEVKAPGQNSRHTGEVLGVTGYHAAQATGRNAAVVHAMADLDQRPEPGKVATIQYRDGRGKVQDRAVEPEKQKQVQR